MPAPRDRNRAGRLIVGCALAIVALAGTSSCHQGGSVAPTSRLDIPASTAEANSASRALGRLADEYWRLHLESDPIEATLLGVHGYDDRMPDKSPEAQEMERGRLLVLRARLEAEVPAAALTVAAGDGRDGGGRDRVTRGLLAAQIDDDLALAACHMEEWAVDPRYGPQTAYLDLAGLQSVKTPVDRQALLARWRAMPRALDQQAANLLRGLASGKASARSEAERVVRQLEELLAKPDAEWPLAAPAQRVSAGSWSESERIKFQTDLAGIIGGGIRPAFARYRDVVRDRILPRARGDAAVGIRNVAGGDVCYRALARIRTSLDLDPAAVHRLGLDELARIRREMQALGPAAVGSADFSEIQRRLRGLPKAPAMFFATREQIEGNAREALARAAAAMPRFLGRVPRTACEVKRIEAHEEKDAPIAYYRAPAIDGSRPGTYYVNTYDPGSRARFEAESLAFHEAIPGHHVQIALAQEMTNVPEFRKHLGVTAFVEGWGLYAERLADELGLYGSPLARLGRLSFESWRAARLVVDTGMHAFGWSRAQAVRFLTENTALAANNIDNEVDRYIGWPAQALAYKLGELEILRLRAEARDKLGAAFDLKRFHDVVLGNGAISLPVLGEEVHRWTTSMKTR